MSGCTCCLYLNHYYNAEKYYEQAILLKKERLENNPQDSLWVNKPEQEVLNKAIEKCSAILERWPGEAEYKPDVLFIMGEAFLRLGNWIKAIQKYDEYLKYFPQGKEVPSVEFNKAVALARSGKPSLARFALKPIIDNPQHTWHPQALTLMAKLQLANDNSTNAIAYLEALLMIKEGNPRLRAQALYQLGELYFQSGAFKTSREKYRSEEIEILGLRMRYQSLRRAAMSAAEEKDFFTAIEDMRDILSQKRFEFGYLENEMLLARYLIQNQEFNQGIAILDKIKLEHPQTGLSSEAFFWQANYYEFFPKDYARAVVYYDSAFNNAPRTPYAAQARSRLDDLKELSFWHATRAIGKTPPEYDFQIAELFLFELDQTDSALYLLDAIVERVSAQPELRARAAYARAFIQDEFKNNQNVSDSLYQYIIHKFPRTEFAQQAQVNLGREVTIITDADKAKVAYEKAEKSYDEITQQSSLHPATFDSLETLALARFDSITSQYPTTPEAAQSLYYQASIYETQHFDQVKAKDYYLILARKYPASIWGIKAQEKLNAKVLLDEKQMKALRANYERSLKEFERRANQRKSRNKAEKERKMRQDKEEEEQLLWDYNDMYDIGQ